MTTIPKKLASNLIAPVPQQDKTQFKIDTVLNQTQAKKASDIFEQKPFDALTQKHVENNRLKTISKWPKKSKTKVSKTKK